MRGELFYGVEEWIIIAISFFFFWGASELGFLIGRRISARGKAQASAHGNMIETALLSLLALLLGFTFMMAMTRFDDRRQALLAESLDIGTTFLRADLLPDGERQKCRLLLKDYLESRIAFYRAGIHFKESQAAIDKSNQLQIRLWQHAVSSVQKDPNPATNGAFLSSLNLVFDDFARSIGATRNHVPEVVLIFLFLTAAITFFVNGYGCGLSGARALRMRLGYIIVVLATLLVIVDFDRPRRGMIQVDEKAMLDLQGQMNLSNHIRSFP